jgi:hypothetical protein
MELWMWLAIGGAIIAIYALVYSLCEIASRADDKIERMNRGKPLSYYLQDYDTTPDGAKDYDTGGDL